MIIEPQYLDILHLPNPIGLSTQTPSHRDDIKGKNLERDNRNKIPIPPELAPQPSATNAKVTDT